MTHPNINQATALLSSVVRDVDDVAAALAALECAAAVDTLYVAGATAGADPATRAITTADATRAIETALQLLAALPAAELTIDVLDAIDLARAARGLLPG